MGKFSYNNQPLGLYLHIPFCASKCGYCDFYSVTETGIQKAYVSALLQHIRAYSTVCSGYTVDTVYLGGGTPSCLEPKFLTRILLEVKNQFPLASAPEITVECNPESTDKRLLRALKKQGVNRLSFGMQSAHEDELRLLGRIHSFAQLQQAVYLAQAEGFTNISLDLMYGLPGQTKAKWLESVGKALLLQPQHLSCYALTLEPTTRMGQQNPCLPDDDTQADMYLALCALLRQNGFEHYEISNFAKPGFRSRHNQKYWDLSDYLGLGPGAHSFLQGRRFAFERDVKAYINGEEILHDEEEIPHFQRQGEYLMLRLRTLDGVDFMQMEQLYNIDASPYESAMERLAAGGLTEHRGTSWHLTEKGFFVSNSIINAVLEVGEKQMKQKQREQKQAQIQAQIQAQPKQASYAPADSAQTQHTPADPAQA